MWETVQESSQESDSKRSGRGCFETSSSASRSVYRGFLSAGDGLRDPLRGGFNESPGDRGAYGGELYAYECFFFFFFFG